MAAYLIADVDVRDPVAFKEYKRGVLETEARYGEKYLGRGGLTKVLEDIPDNTAGIIATP